MSSFMQKLLLSIFLLLMPLTLYAAATTLTGLQVSAKPTQWRLIFTANGPIHYRAFSLHHPPRIVIDIQNATLKHRLNQLLLTGTPVKRIRWSNRKNKALRLVLDLKYPLKRRLNVFPPTRGQQYRLILDLWQASAQSSKPKPIIRKPKKITALRKVIIVIDPGHGGKDPGATGRGGLHEKQVVLAISKSLQKIINQQPGFKAYLTRRGDYYISLRQRLAIARRYKADMFVAIHADAYRNHSANGASVYALSLRGATSEAARWLAKRENQSELMGGVDLADYKNHLVRSVLLNLQQTATIRASLQIGQDLLRYLSKIARLHHRRVEQAAFVVLKSPDIPSLLVESGFISNPREEARLRSPRYRRSLATAVMRGIINYFKQHPPRHTYLAYWKHHPRQQQQRYIVSRGDTLSKIAQRYQTSVTRLRCANRLSSNRLSVGQQLVIPATTS